MRLPVAHNLEFRSGDAIRLVQESHSARKSGCHVSRPLSRTTLFSWTSTPAYLVPSTSDTWSGARLRHHRHRGRAARGGFRADRGGIRLAQPERRIAAVLLRSAGTQAAPVVRVSQADLGRLANASRKLVSKAPHQFGEAGWVDTGYNAIKIRDRQALTAFAANPRVKVVDFKRTTCSHPRCPLWVKRRIR